MRRRASLLVACLMTTGGTLALGGALLGGAPPGWAQQPQGAGEICNPLLETDGDAVVDAGSAPVRTVASQPCPEPEVVAVAPPPPPPPEPEPEPAAGPIFTIAGDVAFDFDSARIKQEFYPTLDEIAAALRANPDQELALVGHTDSIGTDTYNQGLSERRARAVAEYLQTAGVSPGRISVVGVGESRPVASNESEAGRAQNRRVEISAV